MPHPIAPPAHQTPCCYHPNNIIEVFSVWICKKPKSFLPKESLACVESGLLASNARRAWAATQIVTSADTRSFDPPSPLLLATGKFHLFRISSSVCDTVEYASQHASGKTSNRPCPLEINQRINVGQAARCPQIDVNFFLRRVKAFDLQV